ncbi:folate-binding protein [Castellaniella sp.]|uniref:CAF17-like 4Fe-4S cluster assembly/insertion protein YgfZ n=1 Tax=Castellaniella sp. TaxID=1955812 RepID=UPI002AFECBCC|nr:folate-binding protein [Castellaniella sp.]
MKNAFEIDGQWPLDDLAVIQLQGPDAAEFLHGQLSNAVLDLPPDQARPAAYCTAQGRLLANGVIWSDAHDQRISLMVSRDLADGLLRRLRLFVLRAKLDLSLAENHVISGVQGPALVAEALHGLPPWSRQTLDGVDWIVAPHTSAARPAAWRIQPAPRLPTDAHLATPWHAAQIASGWPWIRLASQDMFLPSTLNMDVNGSIDFKKGCYPGQEVVARSHYRGTVKRRLAWGTASWQNSLPVPAAGTDLYAANHAAPARPVGRLIACVLLDGQLYVAAETTLIDGPEAPCVIGSADGPMLMLRLADPGLSA